MNKNIITAFSTGVYWIFSQEGTCTIVYIITKLKYCKQYLLYFTTLQSILLSWIWYTVRSKAPVRSVTVMATSCVKAWVWDSGNVDCNPMLLSHSDHLFFIRCNAKKSHFKKPNVDQGDGKIYSGFLVLSSYFLCTLFVQYWLWYTNG